MTPPAARDTNATRLTARQLASLPSDRYHGELVRGVFMVREPTYTRHGEVTANIIFLLRDYIRTHKIGRIYGSDVGFILARNPDTVRAPDVAFVRTERLSANAYQGTFFPGAPDLAVEVLSPSERLGDIREKVADYRNGGTRLMWVVAPALGAVRAYRHDGTTTTFVRSEWIDGEDVLPGFRCAVAQFFDVE